MRTAVKGDAMKNGDILWNTREGNERTRERERYIYTAVVIYREKYFSYFSIFHLYFISVDF